MPVTEAAAPSSSNPRAFPTMAAEWVWRSMTYGKEQPFRSPSPAPLSQTYA